MSVIINGDGQTEVITNTEKDLEPYSSMSYTHYFLQKEGVDYTVYHMRVDEDNLDSMVELIRSMNPIIVAPGDPGKVKVVCMTGRNWLELRTATISSGPRSLKRMSSFFQQTYVHGSFALQDISIEYVDVPVVAASYHDGRIFISARLVRLLLENAYRNLVGDENVNDTLIPLIMDSIRGRAFNIRGLLPTGFLKGDAIMVENLSHDLVIMDPDNNIKPEIVGLENVVHLHMFPQEQWGEVRANRQMISMMGDWLLPENFIEHAFTKLVDANIEKVRRGEPVYLDRLASVEPDAITEMQSKMSAFYSVTGDLNESLHLTKMNARAFVQTKTHVKRFADEVIKHYPVPFAVRMSIRNSVDYETVYGVAPQVNVGEITLTPFGVILPDLMELDGDIVTDAVERLMSCHGGADGDDHIVLHLRRAADRDEFFGINPGDIFTVNIRDPQGLASDGKSLYREYSITKVADSALPALMEHFGITSEDEIPLVELSNRPKSVMELKGIDYPWTLTGPTGEEELDTDYVFDQLKMILGSSGYGIHANQMMAAARHGLVFDPVASEEDWIDEFTNPTAEGVEVLNAANEELSELLMSSDIVFDPHEAKRLGFYDWDSETFMVHTEPGVFSHLVDYHKEEIDRFSEAATEHLENLLARHRARSTDMLDGTNVVRRPVFNPNGSALTRWGRVPAVLARLYSEEKRFLDHHNIRMSQYIRGHHDTHVATTILRGMGNAVRENRMSADQARTLILEAFVFSYEAATPPQNSSGRITVFNNGDRLLYTNPMFNKLLEILEDVGENLIPISQYQVDEDLQVINVS